MLQRIQSIYLLGIVLLSTVLFFFPLAESGIATQQLVELSWSGINNISRNIYMENVWALTFLMCIIPLLSLISIFMYKNRLLQIRLTVINIILMLGWYGLLFMYVCFFEAKYEVDLSVNVVSLAHLLNILLALIAISSIRKDENLVRSLDRLR